MKIHDILETEQILEGPNDPHIFKAVFLAGGPGSGKSYVARDLLQGTGLKPLNSDDVYEYLARKNNMDLSDPEVVGSPQGQEIRDRAKEITKTREDLYLDGRLGLVIDGTGKDVAKVSKSKNELNELGYDTMMLFVNTSEEVAQQRNSSRKRRIPTIIDYWNYVCCCYSQFCRKSFHPAMKNFLFSLCDVLFERPILLFRISHLP